MRRDIFRIFMVFSVIVITVATVYTVYGVLWLKLYDWTKDALESSVLLNIDILAQTGALNTQDNLVMSLTDLKISQVFVQNIIDTGMESEINQSAYY